MATTRGERQPKRPAGPVENATLFASEFVRNFHTTGAIAPSGKALARALSGHLHSCRADGPRRLLEVGPGTGAVTRQIALRMRPEDTLDLVEANPRFVDFMTDLLATDPQLRRVADRVRILPGLVQEIDLPAGYHAAVSGLPFTNFDGDTVSGILDILLGALQPGARLSFFTYAALRRIKLLTSREPEYVRMVRVEAVVADRMERHQTDREFVLSNLPPAWVYHLRA
jgi:phospholipid N-methyltransferase